MAFQGPLPVPGNVIKMLMHWTESGGLAYSSRFFMGFTGGPPISTDLTALATSCGGAWTSSLYTKFPTTVTLQTVSAQDLSSRAGVMVSHPVGTAGFNGANAVEAGASVMIRFLTNQHYRGGHPKIFLPPATVNDVVQPSSWTTSLQSAVQSEWNSMIAGLMSTTLTSCALSGQVAVSWYEGPYANPDPSPWAPKNVPKYRPTPQIYPVQSVLVNPIIAAQRRRRQATGA
jgi:hypothetical protein